MGCHTLLGEGAYYAPELTKVIERRGEGYVKAVLMTPVPWAPNERKMVAYGFSEEEAMVLIAEITTNIAEPERLSEAVREYMLAEIEAMPITEEEKQFLRVDLEHQ